MGIWSLGFFRRVEIGGRALQGHDEGKATAACARAMLLPDFKGRKRAVVAQVGALLAKCPR